MLAVGIRIHRRKENSACCAPTASFLSLHAMWVCKHKSMMQQCLKVHNFAELARTHYDSKCI